MKKNQSLFIICIFVQCCFYHNVKDYVGDGTINTRCSGYRNAAYCIESTPVYLHDSLNLNLNITSLPSPINHISTVVYLYFNPFDLSLEPLIQEINVVLILKHIDKEYFNFSYPLREFTKYGPPYHCNKDNVFYYYRTGNIKEKIFKSSSFPQSKIRENIEINAFLSNVSQKLERNELYVGLAVGVGP